MAKRKYGFDQAKIDRFIAEGRGKGQGKTYRPWLTIHDVSSHGRSSRPFCFKTGREHHLLSDIETAIFFLVNWRNDICDIREQFPLDREETRRIAAEMGVRHPMDSHSKVDLVMTTDFLLDLSHTGKVLQLAVAAKPVEALDDSRTLEKLEIERRYWARRNIPWSLVTENEYSDQRIQNLRWAHEMYSLEGMQAPHSDYWSDRCRHLRAALQGTTGGTLDMLFERLEVSHGFMPGEALTAFRHLVATRFVDMDLESEFRVSMPITSLAVSKMPAVVKPA